MCLSLDVCFVRCSCRTGEENNAPSIDLNYLLPIAITIKETENNTLSRILHASILKLKASSRTIQAAESSKRCFRSAGLNLVSILAIGFPPGLSVFNPTLHLLPFCFFLNQNSTFSSTFRAASRASIFRLLLYASRKPLSKQALTVVAHGHPAERLFCYWLSAAVGFWEMFLFSDALEIVSIHDG